MSNAIPIIRQAEEGERMWFAGGGVFTWKATAAETGGAFLAFEDHLERGKTTPLHLHPDEDEALYVLDGELLVHVEGESTPWLEAASSSRRGALPTPSWSRPRRRTSSRSRPRAAVSASTARRVSRRRRKRTRRVRRTSPACARSPKGRPASRCSARRPSRVRNQ